VDNLNDKKLYLGSRNICVEGKYNCQESNVRIKKKMFKLFSNNNFVIITSNDATEPTEWRLYIVQNWENLTKNNSIILVLAGVHGYKDGRLGDVDKGLLQDNEGQISFLKRKFEDDMKERNIKIVLEDVGQYMDHAQLDSDNMIDAVKRHNPTVIILAFSWTSNSDLLTILRSAGIYKTLFVKKFGYDLDRALSTFENVNLNFNLLLKELKFESFESALSTLSGIELNILLMVLYQICSDAKLKKDIDEISELPQTSFKSLQDNFKNLQDVVSYANAIKTSGVVEEAKGLVIVVGNSGIGKSSFIRTLEAFCQNDTQIPKSILTGEKQNRKYIETKVLEMVENVELNSSISQKIDITKHPKSSKVNLVKFVQTNEPKKTVQNFAITFYDFGGHREYFICNSLFMKENGVFVVCFDRSKITLDLYFPMVGTYLELISECCKDPTYILMATKDDSPAMENGKVLHQLMATKVDSPASENEKVLYQILETATDHVCSISARSEEDRKITLVNDIFKTSSDKVTKQMLEEFSSNIYSLFQNEAIMDITLRTFPLSWKSLITAIKSKGRVSVKYVQEEYEKKYKVEKNINVQTETIDFINNIEKAINNDIFWLDKDALKLTKNLVDEASQTTKSIMKQEDHQVTEDEIETSHLSENRNKQPKHEIVNQVDFIQQKIGGNMEMSTIERKGSDEVKLILSLFSSLGEILWFKVIDALQDVIIPRPREFIDSIRQIIRHDMKSAFQDIGIGKIKEFRKLNEKGFISEECFVQLCAKTKTFSKEEIWHLLINLRLASHVNEIPPSLYIPSLIDEKNKDFIMEELDGFQRDKSALGFQYLFTRTKKVANLYGEILSSLASKKFVYEEKSQVISFEKAFSEKIEYRRLGVVSGLKGSLEWTIGNRTTPARYDFLLLEYDTDYLADETGFKFAQHKGIRVYLRPEEEHLDTETFNPITLFDDIVKEVINKYNDKKSIERWLVCDTCSMEKQEGYFDDLDVNFRSINDMQKCTNGHQLKQKHKTINPPEQFSLEGFLRDGIENIPKKSFKEVLQQIKAGNVKEGEQIWIYRDASTTCCNPVAVVMKYAHVVVYIGKHPTRDGIYEVVHVHKNTGCCPGILMGKIDRVDIETVIKPKDQG